MMKSYSSLPLEVKALVWWHKIGRNLIGRLLAIIHPFEKRQWFLRSKNEGEDLHEGTNA
jgi:hypothetical protein